MRHVAASSREAHMEMTQLRWWQFTYVFCNHGLFCLAFTWMHVRLGKFITLLASNEFKSIGVVFTRSIVSKLFAEISKVSCISEKPRWQPRGSVQVATIIEFVLAQGLSWAEFRVGCMAGFDDKNLLQHEIRRSREPLKRKFGFVCNISLRQTCSALRKTAQNHPNTLRADQRWCHCVKPPGQKTQEEGRTYRKFVTHDFHTCPERRIFSYCLLRSCVTCGLPIDTSAPLVTPP